MKNTKKLSLGTSVSVALVGICLAGQVNAAMYLLSGDMDVLQATTNTATTGGTGTIAGDYDDVTNLLNYSITWTNLTAAVSNMHFHLGARGTPGGIELAIAGPWSSPQVGSNVLLTETQEANLLEGLWYVNVHTGNFPAGEIRGQVDVSEIPVPATAWLFGSAIAGMGLLRRKAA